MTHTFESTLTQFSKSLLATLNNEPDINYLWFYKNAGICANYEAYLHNVLYLGRDDIRSYVRALMVHFGQEYDSLHYPFGGEGAYNDEFHAETLYDNPLRIEFLKHWAAQ